MISVFGGKGFIGKEFMSLYEDDCILIERESNIPIENTDVLYFISTTSNSHVFSNPYLDIDTNLTKLIKVLENFKKKCKNKTFVFISSWFVYGSSEEIVNENSVCKPKGFYSITKYTAEMLLESYCNSFGIKYKILRLPNVYGGIKNILDITIKKLIANDDVVIFNNGNLIRDFLHITDTANAIKLCLDRANENSIINIGSGIPLNIKDILQYASVKLQSKSKITYVDTPKEHKELEIVNISLDISKLKLLQFKPNLTVYNWIDNTIKTYEY